MARLQLSVPVAVVGVHCRYRAMLKNVQRINMNQCDQCIHIFHKFQTVSMARHVSGMLQKTLGLFFCKNNQSSIAVLPLSRRPHEVADSFSSVAEANQIFAIMQSRNLPTNI